MATFLNNTLGMKAIKFTLIFTFFLDIPSKKRDVKGERGRRGGRQQKLFVPPNMFLSALSELPEGVTTLERVNQPVQRRDSFVLWSP